MNSATPSTPDNWHHALIELVTSGAESAAIEQVEQAYAADLVWLNGFCYYGNLDAQ